MRVHWDRLLSALGCEVTKTKLNEQPCPLHPTTEPTLRIQDGLVSTRFTCTHSNCRFNTGDAIQLVACARNLSSLKAHSLFAAGGELYTTRIDTPESQQEEYNNSDDSQALIKAYLDRCHTALTGLDGCHVVSKWQECGWVAPTGHMPETFGALVPDDMPAAFCTLRGSSRRDVYATHAYQYDGVITGVSVRKTTEPTKSEYIRTWPKPIGIYPTIPRTEASHIIIAADERVVTMIHTLASTVCKALFPVICTVGLPLPPQLQTVATIYLLACNESPLPIRMALQYMATDELIEGAARVPIRVIDLKQRPDIITIRRMQQRPILDNMSTPLPVWLARQLKHLYMTQDLAVVREVIQSIPNLPRVKEDLLVALRTENVDTNLLDAVGNECDSPTTRVVLANGKIVYRTPHGYRGARHANAPADIRLSNVTWDIQEEILDFKGTLWYRCQIYLPDAAQPVNIQLKDSDFTTTSALQLAIERELARINISNKAIVYNRPEFSWCEIRDAFKHTERTVHEIDTYGADSNLDIHFPGMIITDNGTRIVPQTRTLTIPSDVARLYQGFDYRTRCATHLTPYIELWGGQTIEDAAMALGISHVLYCIVQDILCKQAGVIPGVQHLCYIDPLTDTWRPVCEQLNAIFSGVARVPSRPNDSGSTYINEFKRLTRLGSLPLITELPALRAPRLQGFIRDTPINLIGLGDDQQGVAIADISNVLFVALDRAPEEQPDYFPPGRISKLRAALPELIQAIIATTQGKSVDSWRSSLPAHSMFHGLANLFEQCWGLQGRARADELVRKKYIPYNVTRLSEFMQELRILFHLGYKPDNRVEELKKEYAAPSENSGAAAYIMSDIVLVDRAIIPLINRRHRNRRRNSLAQLSESAVTKELQDHGYLVDISPGRYCIDPDRFWAISRDVWEERVTQSLFKPGEKPKFRVLKTA